MFELPEGWSLSPPTQSAPPSDSEVKSYIIDAANKRGIPPQDALDVWSGEGRSAWQSKFVKNGKREPSYGPFQLYTGGGLGNEFQKQTGLDPSNPDTWKQGVDFALDHAKANGWGAWYGAPANLRNRGGYETASSAEPMRLGPPDAAPTAPQGFQLPEGWSTSPPQQIAPQGIPTQQPAQEATAPQPTPWGQIADDAMRATISGGIGGLVGIAGLPGDAIKGARWLADKAGLPTVNTPVPGSEEIGNAVANTIGDYSYQPQTGAGELAGTVAGFTPALVGGSGGALRQGAQLLGTAAASKTAGDVGRMISPQAGVVGDIAGAVMGGGRMAKPTIVGKAPSIIEADRAAASASPVNSAATEAVKRVSQDAYTAADATGATVKGQNFANFLKGLRNDPKLAGLHIPDETFRLAPKDLSVSEFDDLRKKVLKVAMRDADPNKRRIAGAVVDRLDSFFDSPANVSGAGAEAKQALGEARKNWRIYRKSEMIDQIMEVAKDKAGQYSVSGNENAIRTGFRQLSTRIARDKRVSNLFTPDEIKVIRQLSRGGQTRDALRAVGAALNNPLTRGLGLLGIGGVSLAEGNLDPTSAALAAGAFFLGKGARALSGGIAKRNAAHLSELVRSGGKLARNPSITAPVVGEVGSFPLASGLLAARPSQ